MCNMCEYLITCSRSTKQTGLHHFFIFCTIAHWSVYMQYPVQELWKHLVNFHCIFSYLYFQNYGSVYCAKGWLAFLCFWTYRWQSTASLVDAWLSAYSDNWCWMSMGQFIDGQGLGWVSISLCYFAFWRFAPCHSEIHTIYQYLLF